MRHEVKRYDSLIFSFETIIAGAGVPGLIPEISIYSIALDKFWEIFDQLLTTREKEIMLMNMEGDKYFEIADALGISINTVGSKINSAKNKLKDRLTDLEPIYLELIGT